MALKPVPNSHTKIITTRIVYKKGFLSLEKKMNNFDNNLAFLGKSNQREESYSISISF